MVPNCAMRLICNYDHTYNTTDKSMKCPVSAVSRGKFGHIDTMSRLDLFIQVMLCDTFKQKVAGRGIHKAYNNFK